MLSTGHHVFLEVAAHSSFSKAARALYISQPSISRHISLLEKHYNCALFDRRGNTITLTPIGEKIYAYLLEATKLQQKIDYEVSILKTEHEATGNLKLGASTTISLYIIPKILSAYHKEHPKIQVQVINRNAENILNALVEKKIDVGIVEVETKLNSIDYVYFLSDRVIPVCIYSGELAARTDLTISDLCEIPVALRENGSGTLSALSRELGKLGLSVSELNANIRLGGTEALKNFILEDQCLGFLPQRAVVKELARKELKELHIGGLEITRDFFFLTRKGENYGLIKKFIRFAKESVKINS